MMPNTSQFTPVPPKGKRRAHFKPHVLLGAAVSCLAAGAVITLAATGGKLNFASPKNSSVPMKSAAKTPKTAETKGARAQVLGASTGSSGAFRLTQAGGNLVRPMANIGDGRSGFNLSEVDLTPNTASDERDASISPNGEYVAFRSNGRLSSPTSRRLDPTFVGSRYHIFVGRFQNVGGSPTLDIYQVTGQSSLYLNGESQFRPSWDPSSNQLAFASGGTSGQDIYRLSLNLSTGAPSPGEPVKLTTASGPKQSPNWSQSGEIAYSWRPSGHNSFGIYRMSSQGVSVFNQGVAGVNDSFDDLNPTYSVLSSNVIYFSSDRSGARRIWAVRNDGVNLTRITDPTRRENGSANDEDDFPSLSVSLLESSFQFGNSIEQLAFQSNSLIDSSDATRDRNIWSLAVNSNGIASVSPETRPLFYVSSFQNNLFPFVNPPTQTQSASLFNVESAPNGVIRVNRPEGVAYARNSVFVSSRTDNFVARYDARTGERRPSSRAVDTNSAQFTPFSTTAAPDGVPSPSGLAVANTRVYDADGFSVSTPSLLVVSGTDTSTAVFRYSSDNGQPLPGRNNDNALLAGARFTFGEPQNNGLAGANGVPVSEGIAVNRAGTRLYVSNFAKDRINVYSLVNFTVPNSDPVQRYRAGQWIGEIKTTGLPEVPGFQLQGPTGLAFGPDINGTPDSNDNLYVSSSKTNDVFAFELDSLGLATSFAVAVHDDGDGSRSNLLSPEGIKITTETIDNEPQTVLYVAAYGNGINSSQINRYTKSQNASTFEVAGANQDPDDGAWIDLGSFTSGPSYFDFNSAFSESYVPSGFGSFVTGSPTVETSFNSSFVVSNVLSSPAKQNQSQLGNAVPQDFAADVEPAFGRAPQVNSAFATRSRVVFSSTRRVAPNPAATLVNPSGSNSDSGTGALTGTADLWLTVSGDGQSPIIEPQINNYPMLSPAHDSQNYASNPDIGPRTPRSVNGDGLRAGQDVKLALTVRERESGISSIRFAFHDAENNDRFSTDSVPNPINEGMRGITKRERRASAVGGFNYFDSGMSIIFGDDSTGKLTDSGPSPTNGDAAERQPNAVAGDGIYYAAKNIRTPNKEGDYYISILITDRDGNTSEYQYIWGFSTRNFVPTGADLFVSDNTGGQSVSISSENDFSFTSTERFSSVPVESYYLTNWSESSIVGATSGSIVNDQGSPIARSIPTTFDNVDVWRVLARGPVDDDIFASLYPSAVSQIDYMDSSRDFQQKTRSFVDANRCVLWAAPYAGADEVQFDIPGSIKEGATKEQLRNLLRAGGRLFITGRNLLTALGEGAGGNTFRDQELYARPNGKVTGEVAVAVAPASRTNAFPELDDVLFLDYDPRPQYSDLQFAQTRNAPEPDDFRDGSYNHAGTGMDSIAPVQNSNGVRVFPAYTIGGNQNDINSPGGIQGSIVGQRVVKKQGSANSGIESRAVVFSFNFDAVNRRFARINDVPTALDVRRDVAFGIRTWFKTGGVRGQAEDDAGSPVANLLIAVYSNTSSGALHLVRTDQNGFFEITGLPAGESYSVQAIIPGETVRSGNGESLSGDRLKANDVNRNFYRSIPVGTFPVPAGGFTFPVRVRVDRPAPGSVQGRIAANQSGGVGANPLDRDLHTNVAGIQVMLKLKDDVAEPDPNANFVRLAVTDAEGRFTFADALPNIPLQLIVNPIASDLNDVANSEFTADDILHDDRFSRRQVGLGDLRDRKLRRGDIQVVPNESFFVNDTYRNQDTKFDLSTYEDAPIDTAENQNDAPIVITSGETLSGVFSLRAGNSSPRVAANWQVQVVDNDGNTVNDAFGNPLTTVTNAQGRYILTGIPAGSFTIRGKVPASEVEGYDGLFGVRSIPDVAGIPEAEKFTFNVQALIATVTGAVRVNGQPVDGLRVELRNATNNELVAFNGIERADTTGETVANAYTIGFVPDGNYKLVVVRSGTELSGVDDSELTKDITVNAATALVQTVNFDFDVPFATASGRVLLNGTPLQGATIRFITNGSEVESLRATSGANGVFTAGNRSARIAPGQYTVTASYTADGLNLAPVSKSLEVTVSSDGTINLGDFNLQASALSGEVIFNGSSAAGFTVRLFDATQPNTAIRTTTTNSSGRYEFLNIPGGNGSGSGYIIRASRSFGNTTAEGQTQVNTVNNSGVTEAPDIVINIDGLRGRVTVNGNDPASGARVDVLRGSRTVEATTTADENGNYFILAPRDGSYSVQASYTESGRALKPVKKKFRVRNGVYSPSIVNLDLKVSRLVGRVLANNNPVEGARVVLLDSKGRALHEQFTATTNAEGRYLLSGVKSGTYRVQASIDGVTGFVSAKVSNLRTSTAPDINLVRQELRATTVLRIGSSTRVLGGATLDILSSSGGSLGANFRKVTDSDGKATFFGLAPGNYRARVSLRNLVTETSFVMGSGADPETFELVVPSGQGLVVLSDTQGLRTTEAGGIDILGVSLLVKPTSNVTVTLTSGNPNEVRLALSGAAQNSQTLTFTPENWDATQRVTLVGQPDGNADPATNFTINGTSSSSDTLFNGSLSASGINYEVPATPITGPTFPANSRNLISTPFGDINGEITVGDALGSGDYTVYRFNSANQRNLFLSSGAFPGNDWIPMSRSEKMIRGYGYLLATGSSPVTMQIPSQSTLFSGDSYEVDLVRNPNFEAETGSSNVQNGYNIIGFPFDPTLYDGADFFQVQVLADGILYNSLAEAVGAGVLTNRIFTNDSLGRPRELAAVDSTMRPFRGYFVRIATDRVKLIIRARPINGGGGSGGGSSVRPSNASVKKS